MVTMMKANSRKSGLLVAIAAATLMVTANVASAGRGGSASRIKNAVQSGSVDAIIAEIERAERLLCSGCVEPMLALLDHADYRVREAAAWWFARRPAHKRSLSEDSIAALAGDDDIAARNAADILGAFRHPRALPALVAAAQRMDLSAEARAHAVRALGRIRHIDANPTLAAAMADPSAEVKLEALRAWGKILQQQGAAPAAALTSADDVRVRRKAAAVCGTFREAAAREALEDQVLNDPDPAARRNAAWALGRIGDAASRAALEIAVNDPSSLVRTTAEVALGNLR